MFGNIYYGVYRRTGFLVGGVILLLIAAYMLGWMATDEKYGFLTIPLVLGLIGAFIIVKYPTIGFSLMFFLIPLGPVSRIGGVGRSLEFLLGVLLLGIYVSKVLILHEKIKFDRISLLGCMFAACAVLSSVWAYKPEVTLFKAIFRLSQMIALYILIINYCRSERQLNIITMSFIAGAIVAASVTMIKGVNVRGTERVTFAKGFDPNYFSLIVSIAMILIFYYFYQTKSKLLRTIFILSTIIVIYVVIKAQSRGVWVSLPTSFLITSAIMHRNSKIVKYAIRTILVLIIAVLSAYYSGIIDESVTERFETLSYLFSDDLQVRVTGRFQILDVGIEMVKDTMPLGVGYENFRLVWDKYWPLTNPTDFSWESRRSRPPHNTFLAVLAELGIVGFIIFISILIYLFRTMMGIQHSITRFIFMWLVCLIIIDSLTLVTHSMPWFWFILALIILRSKFEKHNKLIAHKNYSYIPG